MTGLDVLIPQKTSTIGEKSMKKHHNVAGKTLVFAGLILAVIMGAAGLRTQKTTTKLAGKSSTISELD